MGTANTVKVGGQLILTLRPTDGGSKSVPADDGPQVEGGGPKAVAQAYSPDSAHVRSAARSMGVIVTAPARTKTSTAEASVVPGRPGTSSRSAIESVATQVQKRRDSGGGVDGSAELQAVSRACWLSSFCQHLGDAIKGCWQGAQACGRGFSRCCQELGD